MAQPTPYTRQTDFSTDEAGLVAGRSTVRTARVDAELDALGLTANETRVNLGIIQRDDTKLRDGAVELHTLAADVRALLATNAARVRGAWLTATAYAVGDLVTQSTNTYICAVAHTSGTFATDLTAVRWLLVALGATVAASSVPFAPTATLAATNVQAAIEEADTENRALSAAASAAVVTALADLASTASGKGSKLVAYILRLAGAVAQWVEDKLARRVDLEDFGAVGDGSTNDTTAVAAALASGAKVVYGTPGKTYLVSHTSTVTINTAAYRYCVAIPTGVTFDLLGATIKSAAAQNSSVVALFSGTDNGFVNAVVDCNKANQTTPATGEIAGVLCYSNTRPRVKNIKAINCRQYAGRFLANTGGDYDGLVCTDSDADGWSFGVTGVSGELREVDMVVGSAHAANCTQVYGGGVQGNPVLVTALRAKIGSLSGNNCAGGLKIQDMADGVTVDQITVLGPTNGTVNSGVKIQGNGAGLQPKRIKVGSIHAESAYGNGLYIADALSVEIGKYHGITNGGGAAATGSDKHDVNIDVPAGGRVFIGAVDADTPTAQCGRVQGAGYCKIDTFFGKTPTGIGLSYAGTGELVIDDLKINDSGSAMTYAFRATGGKGRIGRASTDKAHSTTQSRFAVDSGLYNWKIDEIQLGSTDVLEGVVTLTNAATSTTVTCGHIWKDYVGGATDNFAPLIEIIPINPTARALNSMYAVPVAGSTGTGFAIKHAAAGATDNVFWRVSGWKTISKDIT